MTTIEQALRETARQLAAKRIETAGLDASLLLQKATGMSRLEMILSEDDVLTPDMEKMLEALLERRLCYEPMAYILGEKEFWGLPFQVKPGVLIPRPDTETLIAVVLNLVRDRSVPIKFADIGIGSGCIALSLLHEFPMAQAYGVDISEEALDVAETNAKALGVLDRLTLLHGEGAEPIPEEVSLIVSNPPYISTHEFNGLQPDVREFEPTQALLAGEEGLDVYRSLIPQAYAKLNPGGVLVLEIGHTQRQAVTALLQEEQWQETTCYQDLAGKDRVLAALRR